MRYYPALALASCSLAIAAAPALVEASSEIRRALLDDAPRFRRSRGVQAKPKRKPNRVTVGRRVRRKHRRAA